MLEISFCSCPSKAKTPMLHESWENSHSHSFSKNYPVTLTSVYFVTFLVWFTSWPSQGTRWCCWWSGLDSHLHTSMYFLPQSPLPGCLYALSHSVAENHAFQVEDCSPWVFHPDLLGHFQGALKPASFSHGLWPVPCVLPTAVTVEQEGVLAWREPLGTLLWGDRIMHIIQASAFSSLLFFYYSTLSYIYLEITNHMGVLNFKSLLDERCLELIKPP